jgi:putative FmdB family regulatory protein
MPLYEYKCSRCGDIFEVMQKFSDDPLETHETCGGAVERLIGAPALQFKGSGWYITDYARANGGKSGDKKSDGKPETTSDTKSDGKSDSKSVSKSENKPATPVTTDKK